jgi:DNA-binding transcriptional ArsR family regulator
MPLLQDPRDARARVEVHPSLAVELEWALASAERADYRRDHAALAAVYGSVPELGERVRSLWGPDLAISCGGFIELMVLAHRGGLLRSTDAGELFGRLDALCRQPVADIGLTLELPEDRAATIGRLEVLRTSARTRRRYIEVLTDVWEAVAGVWQREGLRAVDAAVAARRQLAARGAPWTEVARGDCSYGHELDEIVDTLGPSGEIAVVPAYFTHLGLTLDLPNVVLIGVRTDTSGAQARARTELLARRLKTISDPTRLAILDSLRSGPRTITDIAQAFGLAQPTVSNHVKLLRESGLVATDPSGSRRELRVQHDAVVELLDHLDQVLRRPEAPAPA